MKINFRFGRQSGQAVGEQRAEARAQILESPCNPSPVVETSHCHSGALTESSQLRVPVFVCTTLFFFSLGLSSFWYFLRDTLYPDILAATTWYRMGRVKLGFVQPTRATPVHVVTVSPSLVDTYHDNISTVPDSQTFSHPLVEQRAACCEVNLWYGVRICVGTYLPCLAYLHSPPCMWPGTEGGVMKMVG